MNSASHSLLLLMEQVIHPALILQSLGKQKGQITAKPTQRSQLQSEQEFPIHHIHRSIISGMMSTFLVLLSTISWFISLFLCMTLRIMNKWIYELILAPLSFMYLAPTLLSTHELCELLCSSFSFISITILNRLPSDVTNQQSVFTCGYCSFFVLYQDKIFREIFFKSFVLSNQKLMLLNINSHKILPTIAFNQNCIPICPNIK